MINPPVEILVNVPSVGLSDRISVSPIAPYFYVSAAPASVDAFFNDGAHALRMNVGHGGRLDGNIIAFSSTTGEAYQIRCLQCQEPYNIPFRNTGPNAGAWQLLNQFTVSAPIANIDLITAQNPALFSAYKIFISNVTFAGAVAVSMFMRLSADGGASFYSVNDHRRTFMLARDNNTFQGGGNVGLQTFPVATTQANPLIGIGTEITIIRPGTSLPKGVTALSTEYNAGFHGRYDCGYINLTSPVNAARFFDVNTGANFLSGHFELWGIRNV